MLIYEYSRPQVIRKLGAHTTENAFGNSFIRNLMHTFIALSLKIALALFEHLNKWPLEVQENNLLLMLHLLRTVHASVLNKADCIWRKM